MAYQPGFGDVLRLGETDRFDVLAAQAKTLAASGEIRAGAGPGVAIQRDGVAAALAGNHPGTVRSRPSPAYRRSAGQPAPGPCGRVGVGSPGLGVR